VHHVAGLRPLVAEHRRLHHQRAQAVELGASQHGVDRRAGHAERELELVQADPARHALPADPDRKVDPGEPRHALRPARAVAQAARTFILETTDPLVHGLPADAGRARGGGHGPTLRTDAVTNQLALVRVEARPSIDHQGAPLGDVISTTTSTDGAPPSVNNVSGKYI